MIILGKYEILHEVGRGGMGVVYKATDKRLGRTVAIKELVVSEAITGKEREDIIERFKREAQTAANLNHPNVVTVFDVGEENGKNYIAMEFLAGKTLKDYIDEEHKFTFEEILELLIQIAQGLGHAHSRGVVHRDIKPDNMNILENNIVKVTDFGIARIESSSSSSLTQDGTMLGTLGYISPEQLHNSKGVDTRADIFSFGAMMYEIFTNQLPFDGGTIGSTILKIMTEDPVLPSKINPEINPEIEKIILKCLSKEPEDRYQTTKEISDQLTVLKVLGGKAPPTREKVLEKPIIKKEKQNINEPKKAEKPKFSSTLNKKRSIFEKDSSSHNIKSFKSTQPGKEKVFKENIFAKRMSEREKKDNSPDLNESFNKQVSQKISLSFVRVIGKSGNAKGQFSAPRGLSFSKNGNIYVADTQNRRIQVFDIFGNLNMLIQSSSMSSPCGVDVDSKSGNIYVTDSRDAKVRVFDSNGNELNSFGGRGTQKGQFRSTANIKIQNNKIYVTDTEGYKIQVFDLEGKLQTFYGKYGTKPGEYKSPYGISLHDEKIYILDYGIPRVQIIDEKGITRLSFGRRGTGKGEFSIPKGIAVDNEGRIFIADTLNHRVQVFDNNGKWIYMFGSKGNKQGQFMGPEAIGINDKNDVVVLDKGNNRLQVFTLST